MSCRPERSPGLRRQKRARISGQFAALCREHVQGFQEVLFPAPGTSPTRRSTVTNDRRRSSAGQAPWSGQLGPPNPLKRRAFPQVSRPLERAERGDQGGLLLAFLRAFLAENGQAEGRSVAARGAAAWAIRAVTVVTELTAGFQQERTVPCRRYAHQWIEELKGFSLLVRTYVFVENSRR